MSESMRIHRNAHMTFSRLGGCLQLLIWVGGGFIYAEAVLFNLKDPNFPEAERLYRPPNLAVVMESNHKKTKKNKTNFFFFFF